jgi:hypothetical protein
MLTLLFNISVMKNSIVITISIFLLFGCENSNNKTTPPPIPKVEKITSFTKDFWDKHRIDWLKNDVLEEKTNILFIDSMKTFFKQKDPINDVLFKFESVRELSKGKYVTFFSTEYEFGENKKLHIEVFGLSKDTSIINNLETNQKYMISGDFVKSLKYGNEIDEYFEYGGYNVNRGLFPISSIDNDTSIYFGISVFKLKEIIKK